MTPIYSKIYDYDSSLTSSDLDVYSELDRADSLRFKKEMYKKMNEEQDDFVIPDAVHNACIGNYDTIISNEWFKKKLKEKGFLNNLKIKDTIKIDISDKICISGKELRKLILDDEKGTEIMCLFKIMYADVDEIEVGDVLTYIIPEDKMYLSYDEMYQLAFND